MSPFSIYLCVPEYLAQWYAYECHKHHFVHEDITPKSINPMDPVEPIKGSVESITLSHYLTKNPLGRPEPIPEGATLCIGIPYNSRRSPYTYNFLPLSGQRALRRVISNRFKLCLWDEVHTIETLVGNQEDTITTFMENHGITYSDKNWNALAKIYQRLRGTYRLRATHP